MTAASSTALSSTTNTTVGLSPTAVQLAESILNTHARSFRWASVLLPKGARREAAVVYAFCRLADDAVDEAPTPEEGKANLLELLAELDGERDAREIVVAFREVMLVRHIPRRAVDELCAGILADTQEVKVADDGELLRYCYRVAGCVGLLMCGVIGVKDERALPYAIDLGIGMQLTNICRDVVEDLGRDRVYVPKARLLTAGVDPDTLKEDLEQGREPDGVRVVIRNLLDLAERYYASGNAGLHYIPLRARFSMTAAARIYRAIGFELRKRDCTALGGRARTGKLTKLWWLLRAIVYAPFAPKGIPHDDTLHTTLVGLPGTAPPPGAVAAEDAYAPMVLLDRSRDRALPAPS